MAVSKLMSMLGIATVTLLASVGVRAEASYSETIRLVRSMREDELMMVGLKANFAEDIRAGKSPQDASCLARLRYPLITDAIALGISSQLTDAEVAEAIGFYRSALGRKFLDRTYRELAENLAPDTDYLSFDEKAALGKFLRRPVGRKLMQEHITLRDAVTNKVKMRLKVASDDCAAETEVIEGVVWPDTCTTVPRVSPDNACYVQHVLTTYPEDPSDNKTSIDVSCFDSRRGHGYSLASYQGHVKNIDLRWLDARTVAVVVPHDAKPHGKVDARAIRAQVKQIAAAKIKPQQCWDNVSTLYQRRIDMDELLSQTFWMSYREEARCILSKRVEKAQLPGADRNSVVQFRRVTSPEYPYATKQLVFFEWFSTQVHTRSVRIRGAGADSVELTPGGRAAGFHLIGEPAERVLQQLASGAELTLEMQPAVGAAFTIPLPRTDFEWAHADFASCLRSL